MKMKIMPPFSGASARIAKRHKRADIRTSVGLQDRARPRDC